MPGGVIQRISTRFQLCEPLLQERWYRYVEIGKNIAETVARIVASERFGHVSVSSFCETRFICKKPLDELDGGIWVGWKLKCRLRPVHLLSDPSACGS